MFLPLHADVVPLGGLPAGEQQAPRIFRQVGEALRRNRPIPGVDDVYIKPWDTPSPWRDKKRETSMRPRDESPAAAAIDWRLRPAGLPCCSHRRSVPLTARGER